MPIERLLESSELGAKEIKRLDAAYTYALYSLSLVDRDDPLCEIIDRKVIEVGVIDGSDPRQIADMAVKKIGVR